MPIITTIKIGNVTVFKRRGPLSYETNIRDSAVTRIQAFSVVPFLGPPKITGPHWPISRINPATYLMSAESTIRIQIGSKSTLIPYAMIKREKILGDVPYKR